MNTDCLYEINQFGGGVGTHNNHCARDYGDRVHLAPEFHVRINGWCGLLCPSCAKELGKRTGAIIRELEAAA